MSTLIFFVCDVQLFQDHFYCLFSLVKDQLTIFMWVYIWAVFYSTDLLAYYFTNTTLS